MSAPSIDFEDICAALGNRFLASAMGTPVNADAVRKVYPQSTRGALALPAVVLEPQRGTVVAAPSQWKHEMDVDVLLLIAKRSADEARMEAARQRYLPYLLHATADQLKLGLGSESGYSVDKAIPTGWEWDRYDVAGVEYEAVRVAYRVYVTETVSLVP